MHFYTQITKCIKYVCTSTKSIRNFVGLTIIHYKEQVNENGILYKVDCYYNYNDEVERKSIIKIRSLERFNETKSSLNVFHLY